MKKITKKMIDEFNKTYLLEAPLIINQVEGGEHSYEVIIKHGYIKSNTLLNLSDMFYNDLNKFFNEKGIQLSFNNTGTIFWATHIKDKKEE